MENGRGVIHPARDELTAHEDRDGFATGYVPVPTYGAVKSYLRDLGPEFTAEDDPWHGHDTPARETGH